MEHLHADNLLSGVTESVGMNSGDMSAKGSFNDSAYVCSVQISLFSKLNH